MGDSLPRGGAPRKGKIVNLRIQFLDDSVHAFQVPVKALGMALWEAVIRHLQLVESDYFDLQYGDKSGLKSWLDNEKPILKQLPSPDSPLEFCVKFYTPDPGLLDEYTRYLFSLQIKKDLATGSMQCSENTAALVASYIAQAEIGDFIVEEYIDHTYLKSLNAFVPHQTEELLKKLMEYHRQHIGESPAEAESSLLDTARKVDTYGVKLCPAKDHENVSLHLSIAHVGILVFQLHTKINTFSWAKVRKLSFKRKRFLIKLHPESYGASVSSPTFKDKGYYKDTVEFFFESRDECKIFWKKCIEHHAFFRCHTIKKTPRNKTRLVSRGSSFRYSGRTQKQLMTYVRETCVKSPAFERSVSGRISCSRSASVTPKISAKAGLHNSTTDTHNSTASSGSHILSPGLDDPTTPSRTETAEVHSVDSSLSGSRSLPSPKLDRSREGTPGAEVDLPDDDGVASPESRVDRIDERGATSTFVTNAIVSAPLDSNPNNNQNVSANQNANDNDENSQSQSFSLFKDGKVKKLDESSMDTENNLSATFPTKPHLTKDIEHVNSSGEGPTKPNLSSTDTLPSNLKHNVQDSSPEGLGTFSYQKSPNSTLGREHKKVVFADDISSHPTPGKVSEGECKQGEIVKGKNKQETVVKTGSMHVNEEKGKSIGHEKPLRKLVHQDSGKSLSKQDSLTKKSTNLEKGGGILYKGEIVSSFDRKADRKLMKQDNVINEDMPTNKDLATDKASKKLSHKELVADNTSRELPQKEVTTDNVSRKLPQREEAAENVSRKLPQREEAAENVSRKLPQDVSSDKAARKGSVTRESPDKKAVQQELKKMDSFGKAEVTYPKRTGSIEKLQKLDLNTGSDAEKPVRTEKESEDKCKNELNKNRGGKNTGLNGGENMIGDIPYLLHRRHLEKSPEPVKTEEVTSPTDMDEIISNRRSRSLKKKRPSNMQVHQVKVYEGSLPVVPDKGKTEVKSPVSEGNSPVSPVSGGGSPCSDTSSLGSVAGSPVTPGSGVGSPVSPGSRGASPISPGSRGASPISPGSLQQRIGSRSPSGKRGYQSRSPSGKRTPSRTSNDRSPSCNRRMEIVNYHRLPHRDSFSSVDDTTSPTFEKDILKQIQNKENIKENDSAFSECNGEVIKDGTTLPPPLSVAKVPLSSHQASEDNKSNNNLEMVEDITVVQNKLNDNLEKRLTEDKLARKEATGLPTDSKMYGLPQHITQQVQHSYRATSDNPKMAKANNPSVVNACQSGDDPKNVRSSNPTPVSCQPGERGKPGVYISRPEPSKVGSVQTAVNKTSAFHMKNPDKKAKEPFSPVYRPTFSLKQSKDSALSAPKQEETQPKITTKKLNTDGKDNTSVRTKPALPCRKPALPGKKPEIMSKKPALPGKRQDQQTKRTNASRKADQVSLDFSSPAADFILSETDYASKPNRNSITFSTFKPPDSNSTSPRPLSLVSVDENEEEPSISLAADKDPTVRLNQTFHAHPPENVFRPSPKPKLKLGRHPSDQGIEGSKVNEPRKFHKERGYMYSFESVNDPPSAQMFLSGSTDTDVQGSPESVESVDMLEPLENLEENISDGSESSVSEGSNSEFGDDSEHECDSSDNDDAERHKEFLQFAKSLADSGKEITVDSGVGIELSDSGIKDNSPLDPLDQLETLEGSVYEDENQNLPPRNDNNGKRHYTNTTLSSSSDESYHERIVRNKRVSVDPLESLENPHIAELASLSGDSYSDECDSDDHMTSRHRLGAAIPILTISTASSPDDPHRSPSSSLDNEISQSNPS